MTSERSSKRVAVTGLGLMTGLGLDAETTWAGLLAGRSPVKRFSLFDPAGLPCPYGVELPPGADALFAEKIKKRQRDQMTRGTMIAIAAADQALADSGLDLETVPRDRLGVVLGATGTGYSPRTQETDPHRILRNMASAPAAWIGLRHKAEGPAFVVSTACSSGSYAMHAAFSLIASGACDVVISGAADSACNFLDAEGFASLMALATDIEDIATSSRPFDATRNGFVLAEGGGILVLESLDHARRRGARVYAELSLPGLCSEAYNIVSPRPGGGGIARALRAALAGAGLGPEDIDYINAHGTSTPLNDLCETQAIKEVFGDRARSVPVSSTKALTGHCLSAAAGVEAAITCLAVAKGVIPPTWHLTNPDPELDLDYVPNAPRAAEIRHALSNSFGFGGHNAVLVLSRPA
jgi:3-oxoacyl-[acyl-carrier-protein] synthase II